MKLTVHTSLPAWIGRRRERQVAGQAKCVPTLAIAGTRCTRSFSVAKFRSVSDPVEWVSLRALHVTTGVADLNKDLGNSSLLSLPSLVDRGLTPAGLGAPLTSCKKSSVPVTNPC